MKAAIIGYGQVGPLYHQALVSHEAEVLPCDLNSPIYPQDFRSQALQESDLIIVSTPPHTHLEIASYFLCQGKKVILEKPAAINLTELLQLQKLAERQPGCLYLAYHTQPAPQPTGQ
jgi:predicted dehydrogenase